MAAGISKLGIFKEINTIDALAGGNILNWKQVCEMPYQTVYVKLLKNKMENDYQTKYHKILNKKHQTNKK